MPVRPSLLRCLFLGLTLSTAACNSSQTDRGAANPAAEAEEGEKDLSKPLLEPFDPPPLAEIDKTAGWVDMPVLDSIQLMRDRQEGEKPLATPQKALAMKNDSPGANKIICSALGRLPQSDAEVDYNATISRHLLGDVNTLNQIMSSSVQESDVSSLIGFGLISFDWDMTPFAAKDSVVSWQTSKDQLLEKVVIRDDLTWSDGRPITAHDVVFSFQAIMNPKIPVPAQRSGTDQLRWVEAYDDHTVVFFHKEALATNVWNIAFSVIPKHVYGPLFDRLETKDWSDLQDDPDYVKLETSPVVGGSYEVASRRRNAEIVCSRRESWHMHQGKQVRDKPYFRQIRLKVVPEPTVTLIALKSGQIDEMELRPDQWMSQTIGPDFYQGNTKGYGVEWTSFQFGWNMKTPFFRDRRVREAMAYAFDHDEMLSKLCYGLYEPAAGIFHPDGWMASKKPAAPYKQNLDKAEDLLDAAGWLDSDNDGIRDREVNGKILPFEFNMLVRQDPERIRICELLKFNLKQIGVICNISPLEATVLFERTQKKNFVAFMAGWGTGADPDTSINIWGTDEDRNYVGYSNPEVDKLFAQGRREVDRQKRAKIYARIQELIYADQPYTWLYYRNSFYGFNKGLRGWNFSPRGPYHYGPGFSSIWRAAAN